LPYVVRTTKNNGIQGYIIENKKYANEANTLSFAQDTFSVFYQKSKYFTGNKVKILQPKFLHKSEYVMRYLVACFYKSLFHLSWGTGSTVKSIKEVQIQLPIKNKEIDFNFMENFIVRLDAEHVAELEAESVAELEAYLTTTGLKNYTLTQEEQNVLDCLENKTINFESYTYESVFEKIAQGKRLKKDDQISGHIPFVMAGVTNTGIIDYISNPVASFPKNSITIDIFGNTFYRDYDFGAGDDTGVYWSETKKYSKKSMLFFASSMEKSLKTKFSYGKKLRSSQSLQLKMTLPSKNKNIDFMTMNTIISAVQKLIIKDIVLYNDKKIATTKKCIKN